MLIRIAAPMLDRNRNGMIQLSMNSIMTMHAMTTASAT